MLEFDGVPIIIEALFENCPQLKGIHLLSNIALKEYPTLYDPEPDGEFRVCKSYPDADGIAIPWGVKPHIFRTRPLIFVHHDLVQTYLDNPNWDDHFIYDEKRLPEIDTLPGPDSADWLKRDLFADICEEDGFEDPAYSRG